jgi:predicted enzyme related to lactoylglutathione lyase
MHFVQGIGGIFIYADDAPALAAWYAQHFGLEFKAYGASHSVELPGADRRPGDRVCSTTFGIFRAESPLPRPRSARINLRVLDLGATMAALTEAGIAVSRTEGKDDYGRFAWVQDPEGNRLELWEPPKAIE